MKRIILLCLSCATRVTVDTNGAAEEGVDHCPSCGGPLWDVKSLQAGHYTGYDGTDFKMKLRSEADIPAEHGRLIAFTKSQEIQRKRDEAERQIEAARKKLSDLERSR